MNGLRLLGSVAMGFQELRFGLEIGGFDGLGAWKAPFPAAVDLVRDGGLDFAPIAMDDGFGGVWTV